jgi:hypothetical protein
MNNTTHFKAFNVCLVPFRHKYLSIGPILHPYIFSRVSGRNRNAAAHRLQVSPALNGSSWEFSCEYIENCPRKPVTLVLIRMIVGGMVAGNGQHSTEVKNGWAW